MGENMYNVCKSLSECAYAYITEHIKTCIRNMHVLISPPHDPTIFSLSIHEHTEKRWQLFIKDFFGQKRLVEQMNHILAGCPPCNA